MDLWKVRRIVEQVIKLAQDLNAVPQILIVEDNENDLILMSRTLDKLGCQVYTARSAEEANQKIMDRLTSGMTKPYDIILLDLKLDGGSEGTEVLRKMNEHASTVPVVIVTGYPHSEVLMKAVQIGYFGLVQKPLEPEAVKQIFRKHKIEHQAIR